MTFQPIKSALDKLNVYPDDWQDQSVTIEPSEPQPPEIHYDRKWIGLLTIPNQEKKAADRLTALSDKTPTVVYWPNFFGPVVAGNDNGRRKHEHRARSIFPGMLFVSIAIGNIPDYRPFRDIEITPGFRAYLRNGLRHVLYISDHDMGWIERIEMDQNCPKDALVNCPPKADKFRIGQAVRVMVAHVDEWRMGTVSRSYQDGTYNVDIPGFIGRVATMRVFANQMEAV